MEARIRGTSGALPQGERRPPNDPGRRGLTFDSDLHHHQRHRSAARSLSVGNTVYINESSSVRLQSSPVLQRFTVQIIPIDHQVATG